jgi:hypothetical protein
MRLVHQVRLVTSPDCWIHNEYNIRRVEGSSLKMKINISKPVKFLLNFHGLMFGLWTPVLVFLFVLNKTVGYQPGQVCITSLVIGFIVSIIMITIMSIYEAGWTLD